MVRYINFLFLLTSLSYGWTLRVSVNEIKEDKNTQVALGLYRPDDSFPTVGKEYRGRYIDASASSVIYEFKNLEGGLYAVSVYHDSNDNRHLDTNFFGVPTEGYGFSKNVSGVFSAPSFEEASMLIDKDKHIEIRLIY